MDPDGPGRTDRRPAAHRRGAVAALAVRLGLPHRGAADDLPPRARPGRGALDGATGLWWNHRDELCTTTAGPPLLHLDGTWAFPDDSSGLVTSWVFHSLAERLGASPVRLTRGHLEGSGLACAVSDVGAVSVVDHVDGLDLAVAGAPLDLLLSARDALLRRGD